MSVTVIVGAQWGDEGKGKVTHYLAADFDVTTRFQGGSNAGHTVATSGLTFKFNLLPCGVLHPNCTCVLSDGMVIDPGRLIEEINLLKAQGLWYGNLLIGSNAHLVLPYHCLLDELEEARMAGKAIGTTRRGIGPAYADKYARLGIRVGDLLRPAYLKERLSLIAELKNRTLKQVYNSERLVDVQELYEQLIKQGEILAPYICDTVSFMRSALAKGKKILCEGAQGSLLDIDYGTYPYVTSSHSVSAGACLGTGISPDEITHVLGVTKAYCTRVGHGSFPTEIKDSTGELIRERGAEYGTTTGRPRRCGWLDLVLLRYASAINGFKELAVTKIDVLSGLSEVKVCVAYKRNGKLIEVASVADEELSGYEPVYETFEGWEAPSSFHGIEDLPKKIQRFVEFISSELGVRIGILSFGRNTEETILWDSSILTKVNPA